MPESKTPSPGDVVTFECGLDLLRGTVKAHHRDNLWTVMPAEVVRGPVPPPRYVAPVDAAGNPIPYAPPGYEQTRVVDGNGNPTPFRVRANRMTFE